MRFSGFQKLTLLDYPGLVACTLFTQGCNFRCPFCHNAPLVLGPPGDAFSDRDILSYLEKRKGLLEGVVVSGGEPLLHAGLEPFLCQVKDLGYKIKLDTNGTQPEYLERLICRGLVDKVAMDIKNSPALYSKTSGIAAPDMANVSRSKDLLLQGSVEYEFRTTVVKGLHTKNSLYDASLWIRGAKEYYLQGFVDHGQLIDPTGLGAFSEEEMQQLLLSVKSVIPSAAIRGL